MAKKQNIFTFIFVLIAIVAVKYLHHLLLLGFVAYFIALPLDSLRAQLQSKLGSKILSTTVVFTIFWGIVLILLRTCLPYLYEQTQLFVYSIPKYRHYIQETLIPILIAKANKIDGLIAINIVEWIKSGSNQITHFIFNTINDVYSYTVATLHLLVFIALLPIANFYVLKDLNELKNSTLNLSRLINPKMLNFLADCSKILSLYLKAQMKICVIMSIYYSIAILSLGGYFGLFLGIIAGISVAIPFVGILSSFILTSVVTIFYLGMGHHVTYVCLIYFVGQILEGYFITPRIIGEKIGLKPIIMIVAVIAWGKVFGIIGVMLAIPATCVAKVAIEHALILIAQQSDAPAKL